MSDKSIWDDARIARLYGALLLTIACWSIRAAKSSSYASSSMIGESLGTSRGCGLELNRTLLLNPLGLEREGTYGRVGLHSGNDGMMCAPFKQPGFCYRGILSVPVYRTACTAERQGSMSFEAWIGCMVVEVVSYRMGLCYRVLQISSAPVCIDEFLMVVLELDTTSAFDDRTGLCCCRFARFQQKSS